MIPITWALQALNSAYLLEVDFSTLRKLKQLSLRETTPRLPTSFEFSFCFNVPSFKNTVFFQSSFPLAGLVSSCFLGTVNSARVSPRAPGPCSRHRQSLSSDSCRVFSQVGVTAQGTLQAMGIWPSEFFKSKNCHHQSTNSEISSVPLSPAPNKAVEKYTYKSFTNDTFFRIYMI